MLGVEVMLKTTLVMALMAACLGGQQAERDAVSALTALPHGLYRQSAGRWSQLETIAQSGISTKHGASAFAGVPPGAVFNYAGSHASLQFEDRRPVFGIRVDPARSDVPGFNARDLLIVRMSPKKDHRELRVMHGGFASARVGIDSKDITELTVTSVAERTYTAVPTSDLKPGEYLITFRGSKGASGYDFGVKQLPTR